VLPFAARMSAERAIVDAMSDTHRMPMIVDLQRRQPGRRADELLERLQAAVAQDERVSWNETGHARLRIGGEIEDARAALAVRLDELGEDWAEHIAIL
jgi:hypothetical protein